MSTELEKSFSDLAYSHLQDKNPELYKYLIGFQLVEAKDENKKNLGMFALNINGKYFFIPVVFLNGVIKPLLHLMPASTGKFIALTTKTIEVITAPRENNIGRLVDKGTYKSILSNPNLSQFSISPILSKMGSYVRTEKVPSFEKYKNKFSRYYEILPTQIKEAFLRELKTYPDLLVKVSEVYPSILTYVTKNATFAAKKGVTFYDELSPFYSTRINRKIEKRGFAIEDTRDKTTEVLYLDDNTEKYFSGVDSPGSYSTLLKGGRNCIRVILPRPVSVSQVPYRESKCVVIDPVNMSVSNETEKELHVRKLGTDFFKKFWEKSIPISEVSLDDGMSSKKTKLYIILSPSFRNGVEGTYTFPMSVTKKVYSESGGMYLTCSVYGGGFSDINVFVQPVGTDNILVRKNFSELCVTEDCRALEVDYICSYDNEATEYGNWEDLMDYFWCYNVTSKDGRIFISTGEVVEKEANLRHSLEYLMKNLNLSEKTASKILSKDCRFLVKKAVNEEVYPRYEEETGMFPTVEPQPYYDMTRPIIGPANTKPTPDNVFGTIIRGVTTPEMDLMLANQAAQMGHKDVIDMSLIQSVAGHKNIIEEIKQDIPDFMRVVHKLGSYLFKIWWHGEEFTEMFTADDLYELEQSLIELFTKLNDSVITLKSKVRLDYVDA